MKIIINSKWKNSLKPHFKFNNFVPSREVYSILMFCYEAEDQKNCLAFSLCSACSLAIHEQYQPNLWALLA